MADRSTPKTRILLVEDNPGDVELLRLAFESAQLDCALNIIADGGEALAVVRRQGKYAEAPIPDLAILDLNLPKNDGLEVLEAMRSSSAFAPVPVAVLSSSSSPRDRARMEAFQIGRYITKPSDLEEYMKIGFIVRDLLQESRAKPPG